MIHLGLKKKIDFWVGGLGLFLIYLPVRLVGILLRRDHRLDQPRHLVLIKILGGGSLLMIYPFLVSFRERYPNCRVTLICGRSILGFAETYEIFDHIQVIDDREAWSFLSSGLKAFLLLLLKADVSVDLEIHSRMTTLMTTLALVKNRIGLIDRNSFWRKRIYTHGIYTNSVGPIATAYDTLSALFSIKKMDLARVRQQFRQQVMREPLPELSLSAEADYIAIGVGCSDLAYERQMSPDRWASLLMQIHKQNPKARFLFLGGPGDLEQVSKILAQEPAIQQQSLNFCGKLSLRQSLRFLIEAKVFLAIDSALIHLARTLAVPSVSFWGPTSPEALLRDWPQHEMKVFSRLHCSPCVHQTETPPCMGHNICMNHESRFPEVTQFVTQLLTSKDSVDKKTQKLTLSRMEKEVQMTWAYFPATKEPQPLEIEVI